MKKRVICSVYYICKIKRGSEREREREYPIFAFLSTGSITYDLLGCSLNSMRGSRNTPSRIIKFKNILKDKKDRVHYYKQHHFI